MCTDSGAASAWTQGPCDLLQLQTAHGPLFDSDRDRGTVNTDSWRVIARLQSAVGSLAHLPHVPVATR